MKTKLSIPKKQIFLFVILTLVGVLFLEVLIGYCFFQQRQSSRFTAIGTAVRWTLLKLSQPNLTSSSQNDPFLIRSNNDNPFIRYEGGIGYRLHPFITYSGFTGMYREQTILDYFGFRNDEDLYFIEHRNYILVVMTGGSEAAGYSHRTSIAQNLERILNTQGKQKYKVLNLAMPAYTLSHEISAYLQLAYHLKPEFVISHTGFNDLVHGQKVPYNFKRLGLFYPDNLEYWLPRLYKLKLVDPQFPHSRLSHALESRLIVKEFVKNLGKYQNIVRGNGGKLIVGIQRYEELPYLTQFTEVYQMFPEVVKALRKTDQEFIDFTHDIRLTLYRRDPVHTSEEASFLIAKAYAEQILANL